MRERVQSASSRWWLAGVALGLMASASSLYAGSVFMKNGYIIHGSIKEVVEDPKTNQLSAVVIGWENGKVTLMARFIESVVYDPGEKESLAESAKAAATSESTPGEVVERNIPLPTLPVDPLQVLRQEPRPEAKPVVETPARTEGPGAGAVALGERRKIFRGLYASMPQGWTVSTTADAWVIEGTRDAASGTTPRIAGAVFGQELNRRAQMAAAVEQVKKTFSNWSLVEEGPREVGLKEGHEITSRGVHDGATYQIRQILAWVGKFTYLVNCVWAADSGVAPQIEGCLQSFEFVASEMEE